MVELDNNKVLFLFLKTKQDFMKITLMVLLTNIILQILLFVLFVEGFQTNLNLERFNNSQ